MSRNKKHHEIYKVLDQPKGGCELSKFCGQATKGAWWMPWQKQAMKDVASCDKPRGAAEQALLRGFPNGTTRPPSKRTIAG